MREIEEIFISMLLISLAILYANLGSEIFDKPVKEVVVQWGILLISVGLGFLLHELGHKFVAQHYGGLAGFRMWLKGLIFMFITVIFFGVAFAAPGAVYISGRFTRKQIGLIAIAGPLVNYTLSVAFGLLFLVSVAVLPPKSLLVELSVLGMMVNAFLGMFNMLPIPPLDGSKVIKWNPIVWGLALAMGIGLYFGSTALLLI